MWIGASTVMTNATRILQRIQDGEKQASDDLLLVVYDDLRQLAAQKLSRERPGQTLQATALVHEAFLKMQQHPSVFQNDRAHFFRVAAEAMRQILVDHARSKGRQKRGGDRRRAIADVAQLAAEGREEEREAAAWLLADVIMRGPQGFNPGRRLAQGRVYRLRYPVIEAD